LNAIQALSQLSYTPGISAAKIARQEPRRISTGSIEVKKFALAKRPTAGILQRFFSLNFDSFKALSVSRSAGCRNNT
jgi:hypothetical protein